MDIAVPDARDPFHIFYWLSLFSLRHNGDAHYSHIAPTHYLTDLTDNLKMHMHKRHKLSFADTSSYCYKTWQRLNYAVQPNPPNTLSIRKPLIVEGACAVLEDCASQSGQDAGYVTEGIANALIYKR